MTRAARPGLAALSLAAILAVPTILALPARVAAEGNRLALVCEMLAPADEARSDDSGTDAATPPPEHVTFTLAPVRTDRDGAGTIAATGPDGRAGAGVTASHTGPFAWTADTVLHTLTLKGQTADGGARVLWHRLDQAQQQVPPVGQLIELNCKVS